MPPAAPHAMVTFAPMIDCEFSRLLLRYYDVGYVEERHLFGLASVIALWRGWTPQIPVLVGGGLRLAGPPADDRRAGPARAGHADRAARHRRAPAAVLRQHRPAGHRRAHWIRLSAYQVAGLVLQRE